MNIRNAIIMLFVGFVLIYVGLTVILMDQIYEDVFGFTLPGGITLVTFVVCWLLDKPTDLLMKQVDRIYYKVLERYGHDKRNVCD